MPWSRRIDPMQRTVFTKLYGTFDAQETIAAQRSLKRDPEFAPDFRALFDFRAIIKMNLTSSELCEIVENSPFDGSGRRAIVAGRDETSGVMEMYQAFRNGNATTFQIFDNVGEARDWLGLD